MEIVITIHRENLIPNSIHATALPHTYFTTHRTLLMALEAELNWKNLASIELVHLFRRAALSSTATATNLNVQIFNIHTQMKTKICINIRYVPFQAAMWRCSPGMEIHSDDRTRTGSSDLLQQPPSPAGSHQLPPEIVPLSDD